MGVRSAVEVSNKTQHIVVRGVRAYDGFDSAVSVQEHKTHAGQWQSGGEQQR